MILSKDAFELLIDSYECPINVERLIQDSLLYYGLTEGDDELSEW